MIKRLTLVRPIRIITAFQFLRKSSYGIMRILNPVQNKWEINIAALQIFFVGRRLKHSLDYALDDNCARL